VLHHLRNERYFPGSPIGTFDVRLLQDNIPADARNAYERGVEFHKEGRLEEALEAYGSAIRLAPKYIQPITDAGTIYLILNKPEAAMVFLRRGLDMDPDNPVIRLNVALAMMLKKDYDGALKILDGVIPDVADKSLPHLFQARAYYFQKKYVKAAEMARIALTEDPRLLDGWQLLINIAAEQKNYAAVRENLENMRHAINNKEFARFVDDQIATMASSNN
jgi:tetratricopeptide (TPR) repeat protein